jgi:hypothetical protein
MSAETIIAYPEEVRRRLDERVGEDAPRNSPLRGSTKGRPPRAGFLVIRLVDFWKRGFGGMHMNTHRPFSWLIVPCSALMLAVLLSNPAMAHCDSLDGPVVKDAQRALADQNVTPVLKWIPEAEEEEIRRVFDMTLAVRGESEDAKTIADTYFFETLIRIHRASEGEGFTGLKPAGQVDPAFVATDRALAEGDIGPLAKETAAAVEEAIRKRFAEAYEKRQVAEDSVEQGRKYVEAYVRLTHFVEGVHHLVSAGGSPLHEGEDIEGAQVLGAAGVE